MAPRASHLPNHRERSAAQNMRVHGALPLMKLYPTGKVTLERMLAKGWIQVGGSPETYRLTFQLGERRAVFDLRAGSVLNPFAPGLLQQFHCPSVQ